MNRVLGAVLVLAVAGTAEAGIFGGQKKLPRAISLTSDRVERSRAIGSQQSKHPPKKYSGPSWGSAFDQVLKNYPPREPVHHVMRSER